MKIISLIVIIIVLCYLSCFSQETEIPKIRLENFNKLNKNMSPDKVISILQFDSDINKSFSGGIFIGIGLLSQDSNNPSLYSGTLNLHEYKIIFENGMLKGKSIDSSNIGSKVISGKYIYKFIGKTETTWSLVNGKFNSNSVAVQETEVEKRNAIKDAEQFQRNNYKKLKEVKDSLANKGYKIITGKGYDSFVIGKSRLQEIINILGPNYIRKDYHKTSTEIFYPNIGAGFYVYYDRKTENGTLFSIVLRSPFKGFRIEGDLTNNFWGVELNKTTINDLKSRKYRGFWVQPGNIGKVNCLYVNFPYSSGNAVGYRVIFEGTVNGYDESKDYIINEIQISSGLSTD